MAEVRLLGSGGWMPTASRETCCTIVREGDYLLVIDAGTGLRRLVEEQASLSTVSRIDVVLTHFHLDHVVGLSYLPGLPRDLPLILWGPGERLYSRSTQELLATLLDPPLQVGLPRFVKTIREIPEGTFGLGPFETRTRKQQAHSAPTLAYRFDDFLTHCTDTAFDPENAEFAEGSELLMHEAWYTEDAPVATEIHTSGSAAASIARQASVARLVLIHVNPLLPDEDSLLDEAVTEFERSELGIDNLQVI